MPEIGRPTHLIFVGHSGMPDRFEMFSAHHNERDAETMRDRLNQLLSSTHSFVHMIKVPEIEGVVVGAATEPTRHEKSPVPAILTPPKPEKPPVKPYVQVSQDQFIEETMQMMEGGTAKFRDADSRLNEGGAFS